MLRRIALPAALAAMFAAVLLSVETPLFPVLKNSLFAGPQKEGFSLLVTSQILRPWGDQAAIAGRPVEGASSTPRANGSRCSARAAWRSSMRQP